MKQFLTLLMIIVSNVSTVSAQKVYSEQLRSINYENINFQDYVGKKILFVVLPLTNDSIAQQIKAFSVGAHNIKVIGLLSFDDGFEINQVEAVKNVYEGSSIILSEGLKTRKGVNQSLFMQWLTDKNKNRHFNNDVVGIGMKFFVSENGTLFSVLPPAISMNSTIIARIINTQSVQ